MVKFGRYNASVRQRLSNLDSNGLYFVIDYNALKQHATNTATSTKFQEEWTNALRQHQQWLSSTTLALYQEIYSVLPPDAARGLSQDECLRLFVKTINSTSTTSTSTTATSTTSTLSSASDLLRRLKRMALASSNNQQALRKSVKRFDKRKPSTPSMSRCIGFKSTVPKSKSGTLL
jgi:hypothetical protein